jgi:hypothetical protein
VTSADRCHVGRGVHADNDQRCNFASSPPRFAPVSIQHHTHPATRSRPNVLSRDSRFWRRPGGGVATPVMTGGGGAAADAAGMENARNEPASKGPKRRRPNDPPARYGE